MVWKRFAGVVISFAFLCLPLAAAGCAGTTDPRHIAGRRPHFRESPRPRRFRSYREAETSGRVLDNLDG